jgi:SAM-dependent methyltransferase
MDKTTYNSAFFEAQSRGSLRSARIVVPLVAQLVRPHSVVDVGCGVGTWLSEFKDHGVCRILGMDGDYVDPSSLMISRECFRTVDLNRPGGMDEKVDEKFDLAVCLEVAEHLPRTSAEHLVGFLCRLAPVILFSAAMPMQGGTHHVNEQWPDYWAALFRRYHYGRIDAVRKFIWKNSDVEWWYRQNIFLFVHEGSISAYPSLVKFRAEADDLVLVHRNILDKHVWLPELLKRLPARILDATIRRISGACSRVSP